MFNYPKGFTPTEKFRLETRLKQQAISLIEKKFRVSCVGEGGGRFDDVRLYSLHFSQKDEKDVGEARLMLLEVLENCLEVFNNSEELSNYNEGENLSENNFDICLIFFPKRNSEFSRSHLENISYHFGKIYYRYSGNSQEPFEETYEEALKLSKEKENAS